LIARNQSEGQTRATQSPQSPTQTEIELVDDAEAVAMALPKKKSNPTKQI
jgi:hypothetical protein